MIINNFLYQDQLEFFLQVCLYVQYDESSACGIKLESTSTWNKVFRVKTNAGISIYKLDRWD